MSGRTVRNANDEYIRPVRAALGCVTEAGLAFRGTTDTRHSYVLSFQRQPAILRRPTGFSRMFLGVKLGYSVIESDLRPGFLRGVTTFWEYAIYDGDSREIITYHWHPAGLSTTTTPHFHVGSTLLDSAGHELGKTFSRLHLPSGPITVADVVRALIEEFNVTPIHQRWDETLRACQEVIQRGHMFT